MIQAFTKHPASVGESYWQHLRVSFGFGGKMLVAGFGCILHGLFPFICTKTGSNTILTLHERMVTHRDKRTAPCPEASASAEAKAS